jgi:hypothetical protein
VNEILKDQNGQFLTASTDGVQEQHGATAVHLLERIVLALLLGKRAPGTAGYHRAW